MINIKFLLVISIFLCIFYIFYLSYNCTYHEYKESYDSYENDPNKTQIDPKFGITYQNRNYQYGMSVKNILCDDDGTLLSFPLVPPGLICIWGGLKVPKGWSICDGTNGTPDLTSRFIMGATSSSDLKSKGGGNDIRLTDDQIPEHSHVFDTIFDGNKLSLSYNGAHTHTSSASTLRNTGSISIGHTVEQCIPGPLKDCMVEWTKDNEGCWRPPGLFQDCYGVTSIARSWQHTPSHSHTHTISGTTSTSTTSIITTTLSNNIGESSIKSDSIAICINDTKKCYYKDSDQLLNDYMNYKAQPYKTMVDLYDRIGTSNATLYSNLYDMPQDYEKLGFPPNVSYSPPPSRLRDTFRVIPPYYILTYIMKL